MTNTHRCTALAALLALALASCSSDGSSSDGSVPASADASPGCALDPAAAGRQEVGLASGGLERRYVLYVPQGLEAGAPAPLVVDFPAYSPAELEERFSGFTTPDRDGVIKADEVGAIVVTPEPIGGDGALRAWNLTGEAPGFPDDQGFIRDVLEDAGARTCVDRNQVLVMGFAVGGAMATQVACNPERNVAALVTISGPFDPPRCMPGKPVPVLAFHGTNDPLLPFAGGVGPNAVLLGLGPKTLAGLAGAVPYLVGAPSSALAWSERDGCRPEPEISAVSPLVTHQVWTGCADGGAVELYVVEGAGHTWPDSNGMDDLVSLLGPTTRAIAANDVVWDFFQAPRPAGDGSR